MSTCGKRCRRRRHPSWSNHLTARPAPVKAPVPLKSAPAPQPVMKEPPSPKVPDIGLEKKKAEADR